MAEALVVRIRIEGARGTLAAFRGLPKDASAELRDATQKLSEALATQIAAAARSDSPQSALVAGTVKARRDRVPSIQAGGSARVGSRGTPAHKILFGANFGSNTLGQFRPHRASGADDYFFFSTVEDNEARIAEAWRKVADDVLAKWASAPDGLAD